MKKDAIDIDHLCRLAQLELAPGEVDAVREDLENIVLMVDAMGDVNAEGVEPLSHPIEFAARLRDDAVSETVDVALFQALAPETGDQLYLVPRVVD